MALTMWSHSILSLSRNIDIRKQSCERSQPFPLAFPAMLMSLSSITKVAADVEATPTFHLRIELKGQTELPAEAVEKINTLLQEVSEELKLSYALFALHTNVI